jgi:geranylgeranyl transferase type-2 subunit alpha
MAAINPDFYSLWNYRRDILNSFFTQSPEKKAEYCARELKLVEQSFSANPKSYGAWHQRQWVIDQGVSDIAQELSLCDHFLQLDARNFHCWNYRRWVAEKAYTCGAATPLTELKFSTQKINQDFSNYSAWHYRTVLIPRIYTENRDKETPNPEWLDFSAVIDQEFELVSRAFYVDPEDQSGWLYHRWLLGRVVSSGPALPSLGISLGVGFDTDIQESDDHTWQISVFTRELARCRELATMEPNCKWVLLTIAMLIAGLEACKTDPDSSSPTNLSEIQAIFDRLFILDPKRRNYYVDVRTHITTFSR